MNSKLFLTMLHSITVYQLSTGTKFQREINTFVDHVTEVHTARGFQLNLPRHPYSDRFISSDVGENTIFCGFSAFDFHPVDRALGIL